MLNFSIYEVIIILRIIYITVFTIEQYIIYKLIFHISLSIEEGFHNGFGNALIKAGWRKLNVDVVWGNSGLEMNLEILLHGVLSGIGEVLLRYY
ncbi:unnamed protein product [Cuscuta europaea]|uniref:Uncharacterized protein n=1 Tax=Cuscuta europaea TaxID=41803 RepID=A0A9P0ZAG6_CUSEU|nr:unnamed protein product [Cuscuta europaea]